MFSPGFNHSLELWLSNQYRQGSQLYVVIDRTSWGAINLLIVSVVWQHRAIPIWCEALSKKGSSNYDEQTSILSKVISHLSAYRLVILGDREFCSVRLGQWLGQQKVYFCLRLKRNTEVALDRQFTQQLQQFGLARERSKLGETISSKDSETDIQQVRTDTKSDYLNPEMIISINSGRFCS